MMMTINTAPMATMVEPTARSMPPEMMTKVMPSATMPTPALLRRILIQFLPQRCSHAPKLASLKPRAMVWTMIIRTSTQPVENMGLVFQLRAIRWKNVSFFCFATVIGMYLLSRR